jgi:hypothetical protein
MTLFIWGIIIVFSILLIRIYFYYWKKTFKSTKIFYFSSVCVCVCVCVCVSVCLCVCVCVCDFLSFFGVIFLFFKIVYFFFLLFSFFFCGGYLFIFNSCQRARRQVTRMAQRLERRRKDLMILALHVRIPLWDMDGGLLDTEAPCYSRCGT